MHTCLLPLSLSSSLSLHTPGFRHALLFHTHVRLRAPCLVCVVVKPLSPVLTLSSSFACHLISPHTPPPVVACIYSRRVCHLSQPSSPVYTLDMLLPFLSLSLFFLASPHAHTRLPPLELAPPHTDGPAFVLQCLPAACPERRKHARTRVVAHSEKKCSALRTAL